MIRPRSAALAGALSLMLAGAMGPAQGAPAHPTDDAPGLAEQCREPAAETVAKGRPGYGRQPDHRTVTAADKRAIAKRTDRVLRGAGGDDALARRSDPSIRVYVHVMAAADGTGDVTDAQVEEQIAVLNRDFAGAEAPGVAAGTAFTFRLARVDRYYNDKWHIDKQSRKYRAETRLGGADDLNIWLVEFGYLGIATFPWDYSRAGDVDGIRVLWSSLPGGTETNYNEGDTATHEAGHWLGLFHTFDGGCRKRGDEVDDTPAQSVATNGCPEGQDSCPADGLDSIHNYMDYSYDGCYNQFTVGQATRMNEMFAAFRS